MSPNITVIIVGKNFASDAKTLSEQGNDIIAIVADSSDRSPSKGKGIAQGRCEVRQTSSGWGKWKLLDRTRF